MEPVSLILVSICILLLMSNLFKIYNYFVSYVKLLKIPGPSNIPLFGSSLKLLKMDQESRVKWIIQQDKVYNGFYKIYMGPAIVVRIRQPHYVEQLLPSTVNITKSQFYKFLYPWLGKGLLTSTGEKWFSHRKMITPAFHFGILEQYAPVMFEKAEILTNRFEKMVQENPDQPIDVFQYLTMCTLDIICETAMGINMHAQSKNEHEYAKYVQRFSELVTTRFISPWSFYDTVYQFTKDGKEFKAMVEGMHNFTNKVIQSRKLARAEKKSQEANEEDCDDMGQRKRKAFLDILLDANESAESPLTDAEMREHVDTFMFAGHDTTSAAVSWALFSLGNDPEVQAKLHEELDDMFGDSTENATMKQISELKYLERVIKESLRLYPSAPEFSRMLHTKLTINGYEIPAGTVVLMSPFMTHRDPEYWENPLKFDPDRFLPENSKNRHPYSYFPFSAGPRNCIGQKFAMLEAKIIMCSILRKFKVRSLKNHENVRYYFGLILRPIDGIKMYLTPRK